MEISIYLGGNVLMFNKKKHNKTNKQTNKKPINKKQKQTNKKTKKKEDPTHVTI
jgi:hypothetical protein